MDWKDFRFPVSLAKKPRLVQMGFGQHVRSRDIFFQIKTWTIHLYYYGGSIRVNGTEVPIRFGYLGINPPNAKTVYGFDEPACRHIYAHFETEEPQHNETVHRVPVMLDVNATFKSYESRMDTMLKHYHRDRLRAEVVLWELLFKLSEDASRIPSEGTTRHPAVESAMEYIERNLSGYLTAADVAQAAGLSQNHLNHLFHSQFNKTLKDYILDLRMEKAAYFLTSTRLPIKTAAYECGIPDLQHFNKIVRRVFGKSPKKFRETKTPPPGGEGVL